MNQRRLRIFAGPNGSGKSSLIRLIQTYNITFGYFINADELENQLHKKGIDFAGFPFTVFENELFDFITRSTLYDKAGGNNMLKSLSITQHHLSISNFQINSYIAAIIADFLRKQLIKLGLRCSFETVFSDRTKIDTIQMARENGYKVYLYYVATESVQINIERVRNRVKLGGHNVSVDKIESRYYKSLDLLLEIIQLTDRAFLFDNSDELVQVAEAENGKEVKFLEPNIPGWMKQYIINKVL